MVLAAQGQGHGTVKQSAPKSFIYRKGKNDNETFIKYLHTKWHGAGVQLSRRAYLPQLPLCPANQCSGLYVPVMWGRLLPLPEAGARPPEAGGRKNI